MTKKKAKEIALMMTASAVEALIGSADSFENTSEADKEKIIAEIDDITYKLYKRSEKLRDDRRNKSTVTRKI